MTEPRASFPLYKPLRMRTFITLWPYTLDMEEVTNTHDRIEWIADEYDLSKNNAAALILAECGYTASGIASALDVTEGTARKYLDRLESRIAEGVTETLPKSGKYATYPDSDTSPVRYSGDVVDVELGKELPVNKGISLSEVPKEILR